MTRNLAGKQCPSPSPCCLPGTFSLEGFQPAAVAVDCCTGSAERVSGGWDNRLRCMFQFLQIACREWCIRHHIDSSILCSGEPYNQPAPHLRLLGLVIIVGTTLVSQALSAGRASPTMT